LRTEYGVLLKATTVYAQIFFSLSRPESNSTHYGFLNQPFIMTIPTYNESYVIVDRNGIVENRHLVHAAIVDSTGQLLLTLGDPSRITLLRSAAKPAQALAVAETGALEQFGFDDADLALMCASHSSEDRHITRAQRMLAKSRNTEDQLLCGGHPALNPAVNRAWIKRDFEPTGIHNNCSGKHAGMLAGARAMAASSNDYHLLTHPIQVRVRKIVEELSGLSEEEVKWGIDGCNLPAPALPLSYLAKIYASFAQASDALAGGDNITSRIQRMGQIFNAMSQMPEIIGGEGRFCTLLMKAFQGSLIGKVGADGCYGIGMRESELTRSLGAVGAVGISVKIEDGNLDILYAAVTEILQQMKIYSQEDSESLEAYHHPKIKNTKGIVTGTTRFQFNFRSVGGAIPA
jgi:L-asparaginase II